MDDDAKGKSYAILLTKMDAKERLKGCRIINPVKSME
jgi:hypothetical protein